MRTSTIAVGVLCLAATSLVAGCGGSSGASPDAAAANQIAASISKEAAGITGPSDTSGAAGSATPTAQGSASEGAVSQISLRVGNFYTTDAKTAGPALDIYDVSLSGQAATPILTNVAYGTFSPYVNPHIVDGDATGPIDLFALPTGEDPVAHSSDAASIGEVADAGSHPQLTVVLSNNGGSLPQAVLDGMGTSTYVEKGQEDGGNAPQAGQDAAPIAPAPPAGDGELLVSTALLDGVGLHNDGYYLHIDSSCNAPLNGDPNSKGLPYIFAADLPAFPTQFALFPVAAGTHQLSVFSETSEDTPTCAQLTPSVGATSVTVTAGQQDLMFVYGTTLTNLKLAIGPIQ